MSTSSFRRLLPAVIATALFVTVFAGTAMAALPEVTTGEATNVTSTRATLHGTAAFKGSETAYAFFAHPAGEECGNPNPCRTSGVEMLSGGSPQEVSGTIKGLEPETNYEYLLAALDLDSGGFSEGESLEFTTDSRHAAQFEAGSYPATIKGDQDVAVEFGLIEGPATVSCETAELEGSIGEESSSLSLAAEYDECTTGTSNTTIEMNSCDYVTTLDAGGPPYSATYGVVCAEEGDSIEITAHTAGGGVLCPVTIPPQEIDGSLSVSGEDEGGTVRVQGTPTGVKYTTTEKLGCKLMGFSEAGEDAYFEVDATLEALDGSESVGLAVTGGEADVGLFLTGEESEGEASQPHFAAELYPARISGEQSVEVEFGASGGLKVKCDSAQLDGSIGSAASSLSLSADYADCKVGSSNETTIEMNSCDYTLSLDNAGPPYIGGYGVACEKEGDAIEITIFTSGGGVLCPIAIPSQDIGGDLDVSGDGEGTGRSVHIDGTASGVKYTTPNKLGCKLAGLKEAGEDGYLEVDTSLFGIFPG